MRLWRFFTLMLVGVLTPIFVYPIRDTLTDWNRQSGAQAYLAEQAAPATVALIARVRSELAKTPVQTILINGEPVSLARASEEPVAATAEAIPAVEDISLKAGCTYTADEIEAILQEYGSPAAGQGIGAFSVEQCKATGIDNAYWLWMFVYESTAGTAPGWAGRKPDATTTANTGNIICAGYSSCYGPFRDYQGDWKEGTRQHFKLLACYRDGGGDGCEGLWNGRSHTTIEEALNTWAPPSDGNDTSAYATFVMEQTQAARRVKQGEFVAVGGQPTEEITTEASPVELPPGEKVRSEPLPLDGFGVYSRATIEANVLGSLNQSPALQHSVITPGASWSFNESWTVDVSTLTAYDYGVIGESVCDLAARYSSAARQLGLEIRQFQDHLTAANAVDLAIVGPEDNVVIWGTPGQRGGADLVITNTTDKNVHLAGVVEGDAFVVYAWYE